MYKALLELITKYLGIKTVGAISLLFIGAVCYWWVDNNFVTRNALAGEVKVIHKAILTGDDNMGKIIRIGDQAQSLQTLYLRKEIIQREVHINEDKLDSTGKEKWRSRLDQSRKDLEKIKQNISDANKALGME